LLEKIYKGMENTPFTEGVRIGAEHWNSKTHTWDNVYVADKDYPNSPPARIVQPDNTIGQIVDDRLQQLRNQGRFVDSNAYRSEFMNRNYLNTQEDLDAKVGRPVVLPY
jgi:hypothetical protein